MRSLFHGIAALLSWVAFGYYWWLVAQRRLNPSTIRSVSILLILVAVACLLTVIWVLYNRRLARRFRGRRKGRPSPPPLAAEDFLGRRFQQSGGAPLFMAPYAEVEVEGDTKRIVTWIYPPPRPPAREESA